MGNTTTGTKGQFGVLFIGSYRYERDGQVRVYACGRKTLVAVAQVLPLKGGLS